MVREREGIGREGWGGRGREERGRERKQGGKEGWGQERKEVVNREREGRDAAHVKCIITCWSDFITLLSATNFK